MIVLYKGNPGWTDLTRIGTRGIPKMSKAKKRLEPKRRWPPLWFAELAVFRLLVLWFSRIRSRFSRQVESLAKLGQTAFLQSTCVSITMRAGTWEHMERKAPGKRSHATLGGFALAQTRKVELACPQHATNHATNLGDSG
ncbi:hypothetical protein BDZ85DRAFT_130066 [Elsinoe ampelina]|uniref:Uncharacterized protein n=1 Tax=Elsinoe ampelina TaxID=302913 RepID=A0A6A6GAL9_9PEZI|nr:hypothetical protein BDZ85DRAFT_130066 [Elsinoe ampelina]